jgi:hypothetical protein
MRIRSAKAALAFVSFLAMFIPAAAMSGCELVVDFDRSKIAGSDASVGPLDASGGADAANDVAADVSNDVAAETGGDASDAGCTGPSSCPTPGNDCKTATCTGGACGTANKASEATCASNGGKVCDGNGACVKCVAAGDCAATGTVCATPTCSSNTCGTTNAAKGTACTDNSGTVCDGNGHCVALHCNDGVQDADETDIDCGGATCQACADGKKCKAGGDCVDKICTLPDGGTIGTCAAPTCTDGVQNGTETDVDCGGMACDTAGKTCADKKHCGANADCANSFCFGSAPGTCVSCGDGVQDGNETDVDCGGTQCDTAGKTCGTNKKCGGNVDCASANCASADGGFTCQLKGNGTTCGANAQCSSGVCDVGGSGNCCTAACITGGTCGALNCSNTGACTYPSTSCGSPSCNTTTGQLTPVGSCTAGTCTPGSPAACPKGVKCASVTACLGSCAGDGDCQDGVNTYCSGGSCIARGGVGAGCSANDQCVSTLCGPPGTTTGTHCCANGTTCSATVAACGATDCTGGGACSYPGNTVAPASLQTSNDCKKVVCDGSGGSQINADPTDVPGASGTACLINPHCNGTSPAYDNAPVGTTCTSGSDANAHVCGDPAGANGGKCVECNGDPDCVAIGLTTCNTTSGTCS